MSEIVPVILSGGVGSRLWPLSRKKPAETIHPAAYRAKSILRCAGRVNSHGFAEPVVVTSRDHRFLADKQMRECGCVGNILLEPEGKNTAPAVFAAAHHAVSSFGDELLLVMPSDHHIPDQDTFTETVQKGRAAAEAGAVVTFGIEPNRPETGYGYIELGQSTFDGTFPAQKFHEKPDQSTAQKMLDAGNHLWNAGIFLFRASAMLAHARNLVPRHWNWLKWPLMGPVRTKFLAY